MEESVSMKTNVLLTVSSVILLLSACGSSTGPDMQTPAAESADNGGNTDAVKGPRLIRRSTGLFVLDLPGIYHRGQHLYVMDKDPLAPGYGRERVGMVKVLEPDPLKVAWYCRPETKFEEYLKGGGSLPVEGVKADTSIRISKCWGRFLQQADETWRETDEVVDLSLNLGAGDRVAPGDIFEVLANPVVDPGTLTVVSTERVGQCAVSAHDISIDRAVCRLLKQEWPDFTREMWIRGGFVHQQQVEPPETRWIDLTQGGLVSHGGQGPNCHLENGALVVTTSSTRTGDFSMCCVELLNPIDYLFEYPIGLAEIEVAHGEKIDVKLEESGTDHHAFLAFQQKIDGQRSIRKVFTAEERAWKPNLVCITGLETVPGNTIKLTRVGLSSAP
jgi:hypothetical protein